MKNINSHLYEMQNLRQSVPQLQYTGEIPFEEWRSTAEQKLTELLGLPLNNCDPALEIEYEKQGDGFTEYRFTVQTEPDYYVPCHLLVPDGSAKQYPLTICLSGHGAGMHIALGVAKTEKDIKSLEEWPHRAMGPRAIKEGRCALIIEARNFGESSVNGYGTSCAEAAKVSILMGRTLIGERVWDAMRILDAIPEHFPIVNMNDIVCTGNSGGGTATYYLGCIDKRITAVAPSCSVCAYEDSIAAMPHCLCNHIPYIRKYFEMGDLAGLIAPRKLVIAAGKLDTIFPIDGTMRTFEQIKRIYKDAGCEENCALVIGNRGHFNYADLLWEKLHQMGV